MQKVITKSSAEVKEENRISLDNRTCPECGEVHEVSLCYLVTYREFYKCKNEDCGCEWEIIEYRTALHKHEAENNPFDDIKPMTKTIKPKRSFLDRLFGL